jgi:hypothetical protein
LTIENVNTLELLIVAVVRKKSCAFRPEYPVCVIFRFSAVRFPIKLYVMRSYSFPDEVRTAEQEAEFCGYEPMVKVTVTGCEFVPLWTATLTGTEHICSYAPATLELCCTHPIVVGVVMVGDVCST